MTVPDGLALRIALALRADNLVDFLLQQLAQNTEPNAHAQREQSLPRRPNKLPQRLLHALG